MATISRSALVNYSAQQMFDLINDIAAYPSFMPGCFAAEVIDSTPEMIKASLTLGGSSFQQSFVTENELLAPHKMIMRLVEGPFSFFEGHWQFEALSETACKVSLDLEFEFSNPIMAIAAGSKFERIASQQVDALCQRADEIYE